MVRFDGMGGVSLPYESTVAWLNEQRIPRADRPIFRRLWRKLLAGIGKERAERSKRADAERDNRTPNRSRGRR